MRSELAKTLRAGVDGPLSYEKLRTKTDLGTNYAKAMLRYGRGVGLIDSGAQLSALGRRVIEIDTELVRLETQWLLHYHLSAAHGPGPTYWHRAISEHMRPGWTLDRAKLRQAIPELAVLAERSVRNALTALVGTYTKPECLDALGLIRGDKHSVFVREPTRPPAGALAYALGQEWVLNWPGLSILPLEELFRPGGLGAVLYLTPDSLEEGLLELSQMGVLELWRTAPPHQVVRKWVGPEDLAKVVYE